MPTVWCHANEISFFNFTHGFFFSELKNWFGDDVREPQGRSTGHAGHGYHDDTCGDKSNGGVPEARRPARRRYRRRSLFALAGDLCRLRPQLCGLTYRIESGGQNVTVRLADE